MRRSAAEVAFRMLHERRSYYPRARLHWADAFKSSFVDT